MKRIQRAMSTFVLNEEGRDFCKAEEPKFEILNDRIRVFFQP